MTEVYALREHCINFKRGFKMGKDLQQQSTCTVGRGSGGLGVITVISETVNNATIPIRALRAKIWS